MGTRKADQRSPLAITAAAAGGAAALALILGPVASAASSDASSQVAAAHQGRLSVARQAAVEQSAALKASTRTAEKQAAAGLRLAETGSVNTTPYLLGGTAFLVVGAGLLVAVRRHQVLHAG